MCMYICVYISILIKEYIYTNMYLYYKNIKHTYYAIVFFLFISCIAHAFVNHVLSYGARYFNTSCNSCWTNQSARYLQIVAYMHLVRAAIV